MNYRLVLGYVAVLSALSALLFSIRLGGEILENAGKSSLIEFASWSVGSVLVCAVSVLVMLVDAGLERVGTKQN